MSVKLDSIWLLLIWETSKFIGCILQYTQHQVGCSILIKVKGKSTIVFCCSKWSGILTTIPIPIKRLFLQALCGRVTADNAIYLALGAFQNK